MDFEHPASDGLSLKHLYDLVDSIPSRNRLILLDACNSGNDYDEQSNLASRLTNVHSLPSLSDVMENVFLDVRNDYGLDVIAATQSTDFAIEPAQLGHSIFAAALI